MSTRRANELLYDSEAVLRLVDTALAELRKASGGSASEAPHAERALAGEQAVGADASEALPQILVRVSSEITGVLAGLRQSRDVLERAAVEKLQHTGQKLREVNSVTEVAATDIMDAIDRSLSLVDELDAQEADSSDQSAELRAKLREELFGVMGSLQFQDITTQQLNYASSMLVDMERRLLQIARLLDPAALAMGMPPAEDPMQLPAAAFDPGATTGDTESRQALADQIFTVPRRRQ